MASWLVIYFDTGKVGGFIASIPQVMVAGLLCIMWAMLAALGLSNLRYSEAGSSRNIIIIGVSLFFSLSVPAYFQQYGLSPNSNSAVPIYFQPYIVASHGPFRSQYRGVHIIPFLHSYPCLLWLIVTKIFVLIKITVELCNEHGAVIAHGDSVFGSCDFGQHGSGE